MLQPVKWLEWPALKRFQMFCYVPVSYPSPHADSRLKMQRDGHREQKGHGFMKTPYITAAT